ncbi:hypothetical protein N7495_004533 [Penicillium taxi]|uniref:uncharacterized protein n=1 Tax=Penicillium taxi TaxID=168475 RepID=UPI0025451235|nr:uncharacterized protein N7495_004533 [Penicillium taxi]KAJ5899789.1 hypothetical protein N7495_004533 [Penicillium taxi]
MSRPQAALQKWFQISQFTQNPVTLNLCKITSANRHATLVAKRSFNNTHALSAKQLRKSPTWGNGPTRRRRLKLDQSGILLQSLDFREPVEVRLERHETESIYQHQSAIDNDILPKRLSYRTFKDVGAKLITAAWTLKPEASIIRSISSDVETIFHIGSIISREDNDLRQWVHTACALARSPSAVCMLSSNMMKDNLPLHATIFPELERLAEEGYPPAMCLRAKMHVNARQFEEAGLILEKGVLPFLHPSSRRPPPHRDLTFNNLFESPWRLYGLSQASFAETVKSTELRDQLHKKGDDATIIAAMKYNDPEALVEYASLMLNENNLDAYEEAMAKAAAAGSSEACLFLANFYYYTFHGKYPVRGERDSTHTPTSSTNEPKSPVNAILKYISSYFRRYYPREKYRDLAYDWYYLANLRGEPVAVFMCALMKREDGHHVDGRLFLEYTSRQHKKDKQLDETLLRMEDLKLNWFNKEYTPKLPKGLLTLR